MTTERRPGALARWLSAMLSSAAKSALGPQLEAVASGVFGSRVVSTTEERMLDIVDALRPGRVLTEPQRRVLLLSFSPIGWRLVERRTRRGALVEQRVPRYMSDEQIGRALGLTRHQVRHLRGGALREVETAPDLRALRND